MSLNQHISGFTPQFQAWSNLFAAVFFYVVVFLTRAKLRRMAGALIAAFIFTGLNIAWDAVARQAGWWFYPSFSSWILPLPVYFAQDLVWGGAFGLLGWRVKRRFGVRALTVFVLLLSVIGVVRDSVLASVTKAITFPLGDASRFADFACWFSLLTTAQIVIRLVGGPWTHDKLARTPEASSRRT